MLPAKMKDFLIVAITQVIAYVFLFLIAGYIIKGHDDIIAFPIVFICTVAIYVISFVKYPVKLSRWLWGIPIMWGLIMLYCPGQAYGIAGTGSGFDPFPAWLDAIIFTVMLFLLQCVIKLALFIKEGIRKRIYPM